MKWIKLFLIVLLIVSCTAKDLDEGSEDRDRQTESRERDRDRDSSSDEEDDEDDRDSRRAELRNIGSSRDDREVRSTLDKRYTGSAISYDDYDSEKCERDSDCEDLCDDIFASRYRNKCYRSPREFVEELEEGLFTLININRVESVDISPAFIKGVLNIDESILVNLIEDKMSEGGIKRFLMWVAINEDIAQVFNDKDRSDKVLKAAFESLGEIEEPSSKSLRLATGLNVGLQEDEDTFLSLSVEEDNEEAFEIAYNLLKRSCSNKDCKLRVLCARENRSASSRSRVFGSSRRTTCQTSTRQERRARTGGTCYVHGARVWSFLDELIEDDDINERDFEDNAIKVKTCNTYCGREDPRNDKCSVIL